jgi:TPP-dependent pyruvate/acetoin dehydrogenase alpha subunit
MGVKGKVVGRTKKAGAVEGNEQLPYENPLVPNETLRQLYLKMVEARLLEEEMLRQQRKAKARWGLESTRGQEACRVSLTQGLLAGDVVMDSQADGLTGYLLGVKRSMVLRNVKALSSGTKAAAAVHPQKEPQARLLPFGEGAHARLFAAVGAGLLLKSARQKNVVVVYVGAGDVAKGVWREVLQYASKLELPIIFMVLPKAAKNSGKGAGSKISGLARESGVPGIPVDASDAVALYRIAQESLGRIRGDGGPVLVECMAYRVEGEKKNTEHDPIGQLKRFLLDRKVSTEAWMSGVEERFRRHWATAGS